MDKQAELDALAAEIIKAGICSELAAQATQLVMGDGNADADIVFIGEAPGKNENLQGKPFVGATYQLGVLHNAQKLYAEHFQNIQQYKLTVTHQ